jgi:DNA adenine methylase
MKPIDQVTPFLKWAGGKRWLWRKWPELFAIGERQYVEPFLGGAAIFFALKPAKAILSDLNVELVETYKAIQDDPDSVVRLLERHQREHLVDNRYYYRVRDQSPRTIEGRAAKFIYLNRTCFNGLYRVNLKGKFNVPKGTKDTVIFPGDDFKGISKLLDAATITCGDFEATINSASRNDFLFIDPPYTVKHNLNGFLKYNEKIFSWHDQERLADAVRRFALRGGRALIANAAHRSVIDLYGALGDIYRIQRHSVLAADHIHRNAVEEIAVTVGYNVEFAGRSLLRNMPLAVELPRRT